MPSSVRGPPRDVCDFCCAKNHANTACPVCKRFRERDRDQSVLETSAVEEQDAEPTDKRRRQEERRVVTAPRRPSQARAALQSTGAVAHEDCPQRSRIAGPPVAKKVRGDGDSAGDTVEPQEPDTAPDAQTSTPWRPTDIDTLTSTPLPALWQEAPVLIEMCFICGKEPEPDMGGWYKQPFRRRPTDFDASLHNCCRRKYGCLWSRGHSMSGSSTRSRSSLALGPTLGRREKEPKAFRTPLASCVVGPQRRSRRVLKPSRPCWPS